MRMRAALLLSLVLQVSTSGFATAQSPATDLTGTWVVNLAKSNFGTLPPPTVDSFTVTRAGATYQFDATTDVGGQGKQHIMYKWPVGAGEATNDMANGATVHTTVKLKGDTMVVASEIKMQSQTVALQTGRVFRSPDGKSLTREVEIQPLGGPSTDPIRLLFVYDKR
jgi:hypothetical protein